MDLERTIILTLLNVLWITAIWNAFLPGQIFAPIARLLHGNATSVPPKEGLFPDHLNKPLYQCPRCMPSIHGTLWWFMWDMGPWYFWPIYVVCLSGVLVIVAITILNKDY